MPAEATHVKTVFTSGGASIGTASFSGGGNAFGNNSTVINNVIDNDEQKKILSIGKLPFAQADYKDYEAKKNCGSCLPGTRMALLKEMEDWVNGSNDGRMYVLSGPAGIGKSTVAYTIAARAAELGLLSASFFFSQDEVECKNATKFFTTIAYQLCVYDKTFAKVIRDVLLTEHGYAATTKSPQEQLQILILEPLRRVVLSRTQPILIIVDALDECDEDDEHAVVMGLSSLVRLLPPFKVILTTRPQPLISYLVGNRDDHKIFHLQHMEEKVVDADIRLYLSHCLSQEQVKAHLRNSRQQWSASAKEIDSLVQATGRLFIIASTAIRYIFDKVVSNPAAQMKRLLGTSAQNRMAFKNLDQFYALILRNVVPVDCDDDIVDRYQSVIGAILFVQHPLPVTILARLIDREEEDIRAVLDNLQSVISLSSDDIPRVYHRSFLDYITDSTRCKDIKLFVEPRIHHIRIATYCVRIMNNHLKYNILGLGDPARFLSNEAGLKEDGITDEQLQEKIPRQLDYACVYWANHLEVANMENVDLIMLLEKFVHEHTLYWFEVLSLIGKLGSAHITIRAAMRLLQSTSSDLYQLLSDALHFISKFYGLIEKSALHTYYSALPFAPTGSLLYCRYIKEAIHNVWGVDGGPETWDALIANLSHGEEVEAIKFSLDSMQFVSCSEIHRGDSLLTQGKLKVWDAATGTPISTIPGQKFAVANDFSTIASSEDYTIMFYNVNGSARSTMFTASSRIVNLALSSESSRIVAALANGTVWLWDSQNAELIDSLDGYYSQLKFSPTGTRLAYYWSENGIVKLRDGISGGFIADLECGSGRFVFSADGSRMASLSSKLMLWNSDSGERIDDIGDGFGYDLAISANGSLLATATLSFPSCYVKLWSENGGHLHLVKVLYEHSRSIAFSRDNILAIATENTVKLYDVNTYSVISTLPFTGNPTSLAFSPDCIHLAAGSGAGTVSLWDIQRIEPSSPSHESHHQITAFAFSRDCSRLACGFDNGTVELWETIPTMRRIDPFRRGHEERITALVFSPDGRLFASGSDDSGSIKLWNGENGSFRGTIEAPSEVRVMAVSNSILAAAGLDGSVTLWTLDTRRLIHTFEPGLSLAVSIAENSALAAIYYEGFNFLESVTSVRLLDTVNGTTIATFDSPVAAFDSPDEIHTMTFLPNNSQLVAQSKYGAFLSFDLNSKDIIEGPMLEHLVQLPNVPLWRGVPIWYDGKQHCLVALFSQHPTPVPVLWIPHDLHVENWTLGSSMIALFCEDGRLIFLRILSIDHTRCLTTPSFISLFNSPRSLLL